MFLRPPLLIAIASGKVDKIPYSILDDGNAWYDRLRRILYDDVNHKVYLATSEGIHLTDPSLKSPPELLYPQPPASVMGYNVFEKHSKGKILVGSFSGIYSWDPETGNIFDHITKEEHQLVKGPAMPISLNMIAGYYAEPTGHEYTFDYNTGVSGLRHMKNFPGMPELALESRMPLWNLALEMHTARLFKPFMGNLYILFIPLFGLAMLLILFSGIFLWIRKFRRLRRK